MPNAAEIEVMSITHEEIVAELRNAALIKALEKRVAALEDLADDKEGRPRKKADKKDAADTP